MDSFFSCILEVIFQGFDDGLYSIFFKILTIRLIGPHETQ